METATDIRSLRNVVSRLRNDSQVLDRRLKNVETLGKEMQEQNQRMERDLDTIRHQLSQLSQRYLKLLDITGRLACLLEELNPPSMGLQRDGKYSIGGDEA
ncbi:MAG: hypothetical protein K6T83_06705 [Alicyclobacillus sp.]|nr:hypothetical protein [Alicyclobacillus sp.]